MCWSFIVQDWNISQFNLILEFQEGWQQTQILFLYTEDMNCMPNQIFWRGEPWCTFRFPIQFCWNDLGPEDVHVLNDSVFFSSYCNLPHQKVPLYAPITSNTSNAFRLTFFRQGNEKNLVKFAYKVDSELRFICCLVDRKCSISSISKWINFH